MSAASTTNLHGESVSLPGWKTAVSHVCAVLVAIIFLAAGIFKMAVPYLVQQLFDQLKVPAWGNLPLVVTLGIVETTAGVLILIPKYRRIGAWIISALLVIFMGYIGMRYQVLVGKDCSCFPWLKRTVNPMFFVEDGAMLAGAILAGWFARRSAGLRVPLTVLGAAAVISGASFAYNTVHQSGIQVPDTITVDGKPYHLREGRVFLFFYDPTCSHCDEAARHMSTYSWKKDVTVIALPTNDPQWAASFLHDTKLAAKTSLDTAELRKLFTFNYPPYGVALDNGRVKGVVPHYDAPEPQPSLKQLGFVE
jgi:uncharacterized membrane protein YphA (DoxX/SURF4 family)